MKTQTTKAQDGSDVATAWWEVENEDGPPTIEVSAQFQATQVNGRITIGSVDEAPQGVSEESLQDALDAKRQQLAEIAVGRERAKAILQGLK